LSEPLEETIVIEGSIASRITFATQQNDIPLLSDLLVRNGTDEEIENVILSLCCEPAIVGAREWKIDRLNPKSEIRIKDRQIPLSGAQLSELSERLKANLVFSLKAGDKSLAELRRPLTALARNEWGGATYMPELLAAFVMPNDPAISTILKSAGESLRSAGEQPYIDGYQSRQRTRVWQITSAIWSAVSSRRIVYAEPPASFEKQGQKIRTPSEILETGLATCLDSALLFAAAFEQAGLNPVIALTNGHALCGVWLQPQLLPSLTTDDPGELRKFEALKELILFETTMVVSEPPTPFSKAIKTGLNQISENVEDQFIYALDVKRARNQQITPLSFRTPILGSLGEDIEVPDSTNIQGLEISPPLPSFDLGVFDAPPPDTPETRLDAWKRKLLDLTKRNRLLNLKPSKTAIKLHCPNPGLLEDKLADGLRIKIVPELKLTGDANDRDVDLFHSRTGDSLKDNFALEALDQNEVVALLDSKDLDSGLIQLYRKAKSDLEEGGANTLFLAVGMLRWKQSPLEERNYRAPLLLVPVTLERKSASSKVQLVQHDDEPVFNLTLLEFLRQDFELRIPELEGELPEDESGVDVPLILNLMRRAVRDVQGFEVVEEVVLSTFSFAKYLMWKDLAHRTEALKESNFVKHLIESPRDPYTHSADFIQPSEIDTKIHPQDLFMPLPADSSQIVAVQASTTGGDFVLEGPPGTGKSQTIANIIAHNLGLGRKVLFVSEKMAALNVVYDRLKNAGLGDFSLELHSNKANKKEIIQQLNQSWKSRREWEKVNWEQDAEKLKNLRDDLNDFVAALHKPGKTGISPRKAIGRVAYWGDVHVFRLDWSGDIDASPVRSNSDRLKHEDLAKTVGTCFSEIDANDIAAFSIIEQSEWSNAWQAELIEKAIKLTAVTKKLLSSAQKFQKLSRISIQNYNVKNCLALSRLAKCIPIASSSNLSLAFEPNGKANCDALAHALGTLEEYQAQKEKLSANYSDETIPTLPLKEWKTKWDKSKTAFWPLKVVNSWLLTNHVKKNAGLESKPDLESDLNTLSTLQKLLLKMEQKTASLPASAKWQGVRTDHGSLKRDLQATRIIRLSLASLAENPEDASRLKQTGQTFFVEGQELLESGMQAADVGLAVISAQTDFDACWSEFKTFVGTDPQDDAQLELSEIVLRSEKISSLQNRLNAWCRWKASEKAAYSNGLGGLVEALRIGAFAPQDSEEQFKTAYAAWIVVRMIDQRPALRTFSTLLHEEKIQSFRELDSVISKTSVDYIRARLSGEIPDPEDLDRDAGYGVLVKEANKQRRHLSIRQLIGKMGDVVTTLAPCLLMSPLSIAQFLSANDRLFDLVVFDEASQITVWDAIGAIARGKNVIVVGDPKQMPPTSFFDRSATDEDDESVFNEDMESILDEALAAGTKHHRLTGHYRSRHESLIAFSNHRYYGGELLTFPSADTRDSAVSFSHVDGFYLRGKGRTNPEEAKAVVSEVVRRLSDPGCCNQSIGIVTLNSEQQRLITDLLDQARRDDPSLEHYFESSVEEPVFVKNLETVQGDARDIILLSIGYGPTEVGAKTMSMNFGPLNRKGGERRLNVAITRATTEVMIFASFTPDMIDLTRTSASAVRDLKHYLEFAQRGPVALAEAQMSVGSENQYDSEFEEVVANGLRKRGWEIRTQIGISKFRIDLGVIHPDKPGAFLAGVECDGATYHSLPTARDRDRVRHTILENYGWQLVRIWSTDYFIDAERTLDKVHEKLKVLLSDSREAEESTQPAESIIPDIVESDTEFDFTEKDIDEAVAKNVQTTSDKTNTPFKAGTTSNAITTPAQIDPNCFYEPAYLLTIKSLAMSMIERNGPISFDHLCETIARLHGFKRTGSQIKRTIWNAISSHSNRTKAEDGHTILWPSEMPSVSIMKFRGLTNGGQDRSWAQVPYPEKIGLAAAVIAVTDISDAPEAMAQKIGLRQLRNTTRIEFMGLIDAATNLATSDLSDYENNPD